MTLKKNDLRGLSQDINHHFHRQPNSDFLYSLYTPAVSLKHQGNAYSTYTKMQGCFFFLVFFKINVQKIKPGVVSCLPHHSGFWQRAEHTVHHKGQPCWHGDYVWLAYPCTTGPVWTSLLPGDICSCHCAREAIWQFKQEEQY